MDVRASNGFNLLAVGLGSGLGASTRYLCSWLIMTHFAVSGVWSTLAVNVLGSWLIGLYARLTEPDGPLVASPLTRQFVVVGFCGGFTTFSMFSLETLVFIQQQAWGWAGLNIAASLLLWLLAVGLGYRLAGRWCGQRVNPL
jgi:CrcB protein